MADINNKSIDELQSASAIANADLLVLQQNGVAKSVSGSVVKNFVGQKVVEELPNAVSNLGYDYVVDQGTSGNWNYIKYDSGNAIIWGIHPVSPTSSNAVGSCYYTEELEVQPPFRVLSAATAGTVDVSSLLVTNAYYSSSSNVLRFRLLRPAAISTSTTYNVRLQVWCKWK